MKSKRPAESVKNNKEMRLRAAWALVGVPDHQGVAHVGGRIGASRGPTEFRRFLFKMKGRQGVLEALSDLGDAGPISSDILSNHQAAAQRVEKAQIATGLSVVVGGGHDHGYSHLLGIFRGLSKSVKKPKLGCINIDAHLDVRRPNPLISSGSPFYLALEAGLIDPARFVEFGIQSHCNAPELWRYAEKNKVRVIHYSTLRGHKAAKSFASELLRLSKICDQIVISLDLDAAASVFAPGVSAPQAEGFSSSEIIEMMEIAGSCSKVASLGIFELNPVHDEGDKTSRLAATSAYHFVENALRRRPSTVDGHSMRQTRHGLHSSN